MLALRFPAAKLKVDTQIGQARADIEKKLVPQGPNVVRHLALPSKGRSPEWILAEMDTMDAEMVGHADYHEGKLSGAVYRK